MPQTATPRTRIDVELTAPASAPSAGRRRALLALLLLVPVPSLGVLASMVAMPGPIGQAVYMASKLWVAVLPLVWWRLVERQPWSLSPARQGGFGVAAVLGLVIGAIIVGAYLLVGQQVIDTEAMRRVAAGNGLDTPARYLALVAYLILINSVMEEYVWRWFVFRQAQTLAGGTARAGRLAVAASAGLFGLHHFIALKVQFGWLVTVLGTLGVCVGGAVWSGLYLRYRSVWPGYLSHAIVDVAVFIVGWWILFGGP